MTAITVDTLAVTKKLKSSGYSQEQAEAQAEVLADVIDKNPVSKSDFERGLRELEYRLTIKLSGMLVVAIGVITALLKTVH